MGSSYIVYLVATGLVTLIGFGVNKKLKSKFEQYSLIGLSNGLTGKEVAEAMLKYYNITDVQVVSVPGMLTDHYNPANKTVNLSEGVYGQRNVSAAAVAAHECGHAVQHATSYSFLKLRSAIVPVVKVASGMQQFLFMASMFLFSSFPQLLLLTVIVFGVTTLFSFITLPVEFDASNRALAWLRDGHATQPEELAGAKDALHWAAMTYVAAALSALVGFIYLLMRYLGSRD